MKAIINFFNNLFSSKDNGYIGLTSFKKDETKKETLKINKPTVEKTALTGLLKRVS